MPEIEYLPLFILIFAVWAICFLLGGQSWQSIAAFIPFSIGVYIYYGGNSIKDLLILIPVLSVFVMDIHIVISKPKFKGVAWYINYMLVIPLLFAYFYFASQSTSSYSWFSHLAMCVIIIFAGKFWFSDVILLFINRLWVKNRAYFHTRINNVYIKGTGKSRAFYASIYQIGDVEISGFFYQYVRYKKIASQDQVELIIKTGWLGTEFIAGFPKILKRR
jgi:hypothetical protein